MKSSDIPGHYMKMKLEQGKSQERASGLLERVVLPRPAIQRLEAWMKEVTDLLCYQPEVPLAHKTCVVDAMVAFTKEVERMDAERQNSYSTDKFQ